MHNSEQVTSRAARISISSQPANETPLIVHRDTLLGSLPDRRGQRYVLVCDDEGRIIGLVSASEIDRRRYSGNTFERTRWAAMPIGVLSKVSLPECSQGTTERLSSDVSCSAIQEGDNLFGLAIGGDVFLSWQRLESLVTEALSDPLTGLMNRLAYERRLREEWNRAERTDMSIGVVVVDLDDFKGVNDNYGHVVGDELLSRVAHRLESAMRSYDVVARFGGDEFVALCLGCAPGDIRIPMERLLNSLSEIEMEVEGQAVSVRASVGAAVRHSGFSQALPEDLFVAADNCLYEAKTSNDSAWKVEFGCDSDGQLQSVLPRKSGQDERDIPSVENTFSTTQCDV